MIGKFALGATLTVGALAIGAGTTIAGPEKVDYPKNYQSTYTKIDQIDRYDNKTVRILYINSIALAAEPGKPLPFGSVLLLEVRGAQLGPDGNPRLDGEGRFIPDSTIQSVNVQEKRQGWSAEVDEKIRNPNWEYAIFDINGQRRTASTQACMTCHKPRAADDFTFVVAPAIRELKAKK
jgi:hypothetical protein